MEGMYIYIYILSLRFHIDLYIYIPMVGFLNLSKKSIHTMKQVIIYVIVLQMEFMGFFDFWNGKMKKPAG